MNKRLIIGISGKPRSGKDTVAAFFVEEFPGITRVNFSKAIAQEYDATHGTTTEFNEEEKDHHRTGLAELAHKRRLEDPHYWVKRTLIHEGPLLVAGVRAVSEAEAVKKAGGLLIRVEAQRATLQGRMGDHYDKHAHHLVETHLDDYQDWDFVIKNDGGLEDLRLVVQEVAQKIKRKWGNKQS